MLNPDFWIDEELGTVSPYARLLYMGLWGICDDNNATVPDRPEWIKLQVLPYDSVNPRELLEELEKIGKIVKFTSEGKSFWWLRNFHKHQKVDHPSRSKYPKYPQARRALGESSTSPRHELTNQLIKKGKSSQEEENADTIKISAKAERIAGNIRALVQKRKV